MTTNNNIMKEKNAYSEAQQILYKTEGVTPISKFVKLSEEIQNIHYLEIGEGDPLILIHGGGGNSDQWANIIKHLKSKHKLYIVDRPGCGLSGSFNYRGIDFKEHCITFIKLFMDSLNISVANFAANSMGGYWATLFALKHPNKVKKIVFLGAPAGYDLKLPFFLRLLGTRGVNNFLWSTIAKPSLKGTKELYKMLLVADSSKLSNEFINCSYLASILPAYKLGWLTLLENISTLKGFRKDYFIANDVRLIKNPTLFLWGDKDAFQSAIEGEKISKTMQTSSFDIIGDAGHLPWLDQPELCSAKMNGFFKD